MFTTQVPVFDTQRAYVTFDVVWADGGSVTNMEVDHALAWFTTMVTPGSGYTRSGRFGRIVARAHVATIKARHLSLANPGWGGVNVPVNGNPDGFRRLIESRWDARGGDPTNPCPHCVRAGVVA